MNNEVYQCFGCIIYVWCIKFLLDIYIYTVHTYINIHLLSLQNMSKIWIKSIVILWVVMSCLWKKIQVCQKTPSTVLNLKNAVVCLDIQLFGWALDVWCRWSEGNTWTDNQPGDSAAVTFWFPNWRSLDPLKGHLTIPKRSLWITNQCNEISSWG